MAGDPDRFRVSPSLTNLPMVVSPPVDNAGPRQLVEAGQAISRAGAVASSLYEDVLKEQNATRVTEALTQLTERRNEMTYGEAGWASQTGKNALERPDGKSLDEEFGGEFDNTIKTLELGLGNDAQRRMFRENASRMSLELRGRIQAHTTEQGRAYRLETSAGLVDTASRQLAMARTPEEIAEARGLIERGAQSIFDIKGTPEEARSETLRQLYTPGHLAQLAALMDADNIDGAEAYFNEHSGDLTVEAYGKVSGALVEQRALIKGENLGEQVWGQFQGQAAAAAPQDVLPPVVGNFVETGSFDEARPGHRHAGKDMAMPLNTAVRAGADGTVRVKRDPKGYGLYVDLELDNGTVLRMAHLNSAEVENGARVRQGDVIAKSGNSGRSTGPHLHYEVRVNGQATDPDAWHQGRPKTAGGQANGSLSAMLQHIDERDDWTVKEKARAKEIVKERWNARENDETRAKEQILSKAFAEIDQRGSLSQSTRAALVGSGQGSALSSLRSFEKATQERRAGKPVSEADSLEAYGRVAVGIADGEIGTIDDLLKFKPYVTDTQFKQLADKFASSARNPRDKAAEILKEMQTDVQNSRIFIDDDEKFDKKRYNQFVGTVVSTIDGRELVTGKPVTKEERRDIVLGLLAADKVNGEASFNFETRQLYDNIPARARLTITNGLRSRGVKNPTISQIVGTWQQLSSGAQERYR